MTIDELKQRMGDEYAGIDTIRDGIAYLLRYPAEMHKRGILAKETLLQLLPKEQLRDFNIFILEDGECLDIDFSMDTYYVFGGEVLGSASDYNWEVYLFGNAKAKLPSGGKVHLFDRASCKTLTPSTIFNVETLKFCAHDHAYIKGGFLEGECYDESYADVVEGDVELHDHSCVLLRGGKAAFYDRSFGIANYDSIVLVESEDAWVIPIGNWVRTRWEHRARIGEPILIPEDREFIEHKVDFLFEVEDKEAYLKRHFIPQKLFEVKECRFYRDFIYDVLTNCSRVEYPDPLWAHPVKEATYKDPRLFVPGRRNNIFLTEKNTLFEIRDEIDAEQYVTMMTQYCYYIANIWFDPLLDPEVYLMREYRCTLFTPEECQCIKILNRQLWALLAVAENEALNQRDEYGRLLYKKGEPLTAHDMKSDDFSAYEVKDLLSQAEDTVTVDSEAMRDYMLGYMCGRDDSVRLLESIKGL